MRNLLIYLVGAVAMVIGFTALAAAQRRPADAIYDASAVVATNIKGIRTFNPPPAGFNPVAATDEQLATYGFPPRPNQNDTRNYGMWVNAMANAKNRWAGQLKATRYKSTPLREAQAPEGAEARPEGAPTTTYSLNWSGFINTNTLKKYSTTSSFYIIYSNFNVPIAQEAFNSTSFESGTICDNDSDLVAMWNGIDGDQDQNALLQGGTLSGISCAEEFSGYPMNATEYISWVEWYPAYPIIAAFSVNPGDDFYVVTWDTTATQGYVFLEDETTQTWITVGITPNGGAGLIGNSAEYVVERPCCIDVNGTEYPYPLANYVQDFWAPNDYAQTFAQYKAGTTTYYPGSTSTTNYLTIMVNDEDTANISVPQAMGNFGIFFQAEKCALIGGCTP
jgi:hypothetical protein